MQKRSEERSIALHKEIAKKLRSNPELWDIPKKNLAKWQKMKGKEISSFIEWEYILNNKTKEQILSILVSDAEESIRLRSSSPFTGILSESERKLIFDSYSFNRSDSVCIE